MTQSNQQQKMPSQNQSQKYAPDVRAEKNENKQPRSAEDRNSKSEAEQKWGQKSGSQY